MYNYKSKDEDFLIEVERMDGKPIKVFVSDEETINGAMGKLADLLRNSHITFKGTERWERDGVKFNGKPA
jgi:hypothetical protein